MLRQRTCDACTDPTVVAAAAAATSATRSITGAAVTVTLAGAALATGATIVPLAAVQTTDVLAATAAAAAANEHIQAAVGQKSRIHMESCRVITLAAVVMALPRPAWVSHGKSIKMISDLLLV